VIRKTDVSVLCDTPEARALGELIGLRDRNGGMESEFWGHPTFSALPDGTVLAHLPMNVRNLSVLHGCGAVPAPDDPETQRRLAFFRKRPAAFQSPLALKPFQVEGGQWLLEHDLSCILAFAVGLGKTVTSIAAMLSRPDLFLPAVIIAPAHVKMNWGDEWCKWGGDPEEAVVLFGRTPSAAAIEGRKLIILNHHILAGWADTLIESGARTMLVDEAHNFVNSNTKTYPVAERLAKACSGRVLLLTATPLVNELADLWSLCNLINPDILGTKGVFTETFMPEEKVKARMFASRWKGAFQKSGWRDVSKAKLPKALAARRAEELKEILHRTVILRKKKSDVIDQLPDITETHLRVDIPETTKEGIAFWDIERDCAFKIAEAKDDILASGQMLPAMARAKRNAATALIPYAAEWISDFLSESDETEKLVVIGWSVEPLQTLHAKFKKESLLVNGDIDAKKKHERGFEFRDNPLKRVLFGNMKSIGTGIDGLVVARTELFIELPPNDMGLEQIKGRIDRLSQLAKALSYVYMTVRGSIEEKHGWKLIRKKKALSDSLGL
jgi:superfamily II DNA or RNA helicase